MRTIKYGFLCGVVAFAVNTMHAQTIVNTETLMLDSEEAFQWTIGLGGDFSAGNSSVVDLTLDGGCAWALEAWEVKASGHGRSCPRWERRPIISLWTNSYHAWRCECGTARIRVCPNLSKQRTPFESTKSHWGGRKAEVVKSRTFFLDASLGRLARTLIPTQKNQKNCRKTWCTTASSYRSVGMCQKMCRCERPLSFSPVTWMCPTPEFS